MPKCYTCQGKNFNMRGECLDCATAFQESLPENLESLEDRISDLENKVNILEDIVETLRQELERDKC